MTALGEKNVGLGLKFGLESVFSIFYTRRYERTHVIDRTMHTMAYKCSIHTDHTLRTDCTNHVICAHGAASTRHSHIQTMSPQDFFVSCTRIAYYQKGMQHAEPNDHRRHAHIHKQRAHSAIKLRYNISRPRKQPRGTSPAPTAVARACYRVTNNFT